MKILKTSFTGLLFIALIFTGLSSNIIASAQPTEDQLNSYLEENGYPNEVIQILEFEQKKDLMNEGGVYSSHSISSSSLFESLELLPEEEVERIEQQFVEMYGDISLLALSNFTASLVISQVNTSVSGLAEISVSYNWDWDYIPFFYDDR